MHWVMMVVVCFVPNGKDMREAWHFQMPVQIETCITATQVMARGGRRGAFLVRCEPGAFIRPEIR